MCSSLKRIRSHDVKFRDNPFGGNIILLMGFFYYNSTTQFKMELINLKVLGGLTGSGKTEILHELLLMGEQVIDLESIACHRGSIFGNINGKSQPSINDFNETIAKNLKKLNYNRPVWIEYKGQYFGIKWQ